jgi:hypothetical protein
MNCTETQQYLSEYVDGELSFTQRQRIELHLKRCIECQRELSMLRSLLSEVALLPTSIAPVHDLWESTARRLGDQKNIPPGNPFAVPQQRDHTQDEPAHHSLRRYGWIKSITLLAAVLIIGFGAFWLTRDSSSPGWQVARVQGSPEIASTRFTDAGHLHIGETLETDATSRARINVGVIGNVDVEPSSRVQLLQAKTTDHRLVLHRGTIHAKIWAPPRLFFVETPSATAVDLGCEYTLSVDDHGASILRVNTGWVAMEFGGHESIVPAGAMCITYSGFGPGTPYREDASVQLRAALQKFDFEHGGAGSLTTVLSEARKDDSITLWHLLMRVGAEDRPRVYDRLTTLVSPPEFVTREGILQGNREMLEAWQSHLDLGQNKWWQFWN